MNNDIIRCRKNLSCLSGLRCQKTGMDSLNALPVMVLRNNPGADHQCLRNTLYTPCLSLHKKE